MTDADFANQLLLDQKIVLEPTPEQHVNSLQTCSVKDWDATESSVKAEWRKGDEAYDRIVREQNAYILNEDIL